MEGYLNRIWKEARHIFRGVNIDGEDHMAVIYRGVKVIKSSSGSIRIYCTDNDFYKDITHFFSGLSFEEEVDLYLKYKYIQKLDKISDMIQREMSRHKNHKRFVYLKKMRNEYLNKYNEINTKETTRR